MKNRVLRANSMLLCSALIWGTTFVAQRVGMEHMGPLTFNGIRFAMGAMALFPVLLFLKRRRARTPVPGAYLVRGGIAMGLVLFLGAWLQQFGLCFTTAGKAGFLTGLYVVFVPLVGIFLQHRYGLGTWAGAALTILGMYLLSVTEALTMSQGDVLVVVSAFFWGLHVLIIDHWGKGLDAVDSVTLCAVQFALCSGASLASALIFETIAWESIRNALIPILYSGLMSVGVGYTFQVVAQRDARPASAAIILSLEAVFAVVAGWIVLDETLTIRAMLGCTLMLSGMIWSQARP
ncbi:DMT family transporter [Desulfovibrionales bacterium]